MINELNIPIRDTLWQCRISQGPCIKVIEVY